MKAIAYRGYKHWLSLQVEIVSHLAQVLGTNLGSSVRAISTQLIAEPSSQASKRYLI